jgi:hypothetical protein
MKMELRQLSMVLICGLLIICDSLSSVEDAEVSTKVEQGQLFTIEKKLDLPEEAYPALKIYLETLFFSRPLPWPYHIDGFDVQPGKVVVRGRVLEDGAYIIPLGVLWWNGIPYVLPSFSCTGVSQPMPTVSVADLLLPFPAIAILPTDQNIHVEREIMALNQKSGILGLYWAGLWRNCLAILGLFLVCVPAATQLWRWYSVKRRPSAVSVPLTPGIVFREIQAQYRHGKRPWEKVLFTLNSIVPHPSSTLTSYELEQYFTACGDAKFAEAATIIEKYGYRPEKDQYFDQVLQLLEKGLSERNFL